MADPIPWTGTPATPPAITWEGEGTLTDVVPPPLDDGSWCDLPITLENVLRTLRLTADDPDTAAVTAALTAAVSLIDQFLDRIDPLPGPPPPPPVQTAVEVLTVELYRRKDAPFALLDATLPEDVATDIGQLPALQPVTALLLPYKQRWGFA